MTDQDIAREQCAQRAFILQKQRMKKGKQAIEKKAKILKGQVNVQKNTESLSLPRRKPEFCKLMLRHTNNTESLSLLTRKSKFWRIKLRHKKNRESLPP